MSNMNGQYILHALETLEQPATLKDIVSVVAKSFGLTTNEVKKTVKETLSGGVKHGYVKYSNRKYCSANYDADEGDSVEKKNLVKAKDDRQPKDASRARRRRRSSSRRRQRSGSQSSRSRRRRSSKR